MASIAARFFAAVGLRAGLYAETNQFRYRPLKMPEKSLYKRKLPDIYSYYDTCCYCGHGSDNTNGWRAVSFAQVGASGGRLFILKTVSQNRQP